MQGLDPQGIERTAGIELRPSGRSHNSPRSGQVPGALTDSLSPNGCITNLPARRGYGFRPKHTRLPMLFRIPIDRKRLDSAALQQRAFH